MIKARRYTATYQYIDSYNNVNNISFHFYSFAKKGTKANKHDAKKEFESRFPELQYLDVSDIWLD